MAGKGFYFGTLGYSAGDVLELHTEMKETNKYCPRILWAVIVLGFTCYGVYQLYLCIESYEDPSWSPEISHFDTSLFPAFLVCPIDEGQYDIPIDSARCTYFNDGLAGNSTSCSLIALHVTTGRFKMARCIAANYLPGFAVTSSETQQSFVQVQFRTDKIDAIPPPFAVVLYIPGDDVTEPDDDVGNQSPSFIAVRGNQYWVAITRSGERTLAGTNTYTFYASSSSAALGTDEVILTFSYATFDALFAAQVVQYDWLTLLEELGGAIALACVAHYLIMASWEKIHTLYRQYWLGETILDDEEDEEVKEVVVSSIPGTVLHHDKEYEDEVVVEEHQLQ